MKTNARIQTVAVVNGVIIFQETSDVRALMATHYNKTKKHAKVRIALSSNVGSGLIFCPCSKKALRSSEGFLCIRYPDPVVYLQNYLPNNWDLCILTSLSFHPRCTSLMSSSLLKMVLFHHNLCLGSAKIQNQIALASLLDVTVLIWSGRLRMLKHRLKLVLLSFRFCQTLFCLFPTDIDECTKYPFLCQHKCMNLPGSYRCVCPETKKAHPNGFLCL